MESWKDVFNKSGKEPSEYIWTEVATKGNKNILPKLRDVFYAFALTPFDDVRVVIVGQDPYPTPGHAMGLAFSVHKGVALPGSLRNIFKELKDDLNIEAKHGDLSSWAKQGVLLLNTALTVESGKPGSHAALWENFTTDVIKKISSEKNKVVFVLWGAHAQSYRPLIDETKHIVITGTHPSPLAVSRGGFFGTKPFSRINAELETPIDWRLE